MEKDVEKFIKRWFIGLLFEKTENVNINLTGEIQMFTNTVHQQAVKINMFKEGMKIEAKHVKRKQLNQFLPSGVIRTKKKSMNSSDASNNKTETDNKLTNQSLEDSLVNCSDASLEVSCDGLPVEKEGTPDKSTLEQPLLDEAKNGSDLSKPSASSSEDNVGQTSSDSVATKGETTGDVSSSAPRPELASPETENKESRGVKRPSSPLESSAKRVRQEEGEDKAGTTSVHSGEVSRGVKRHSSPLDEESSPLKHVREELEEKELSTKEVKETPKELLDSLEETLPSQIQVVKNSIKLKLK